jgi:hypothetical protein
LNRFSDTGQLNLVKQTRWLNAGASEPNSIALAAWFCLLSVVVNSIHRRKRRFCRVQVNWR